MSTEVDTSTVTTSTTTALPETSYPPEDDLDIAHYAVVFSQVGAFTLEGSNLKRLICTFCATLYFSLVSHRLRPDGHVQPGCLLDLCTPQFDDKVGSKDE